MKGRVDYDVWFSRERRIVKREKSHCLSAEI
jgi:hypothetical protein